MSDAIGSKNTCKTFSTGSASRNCVEKALFRLWKKARFGGQSKRPFSTDKSDCIRNGLLVLLLIVSRVDFIVFVLFLEAVGVRKYCCTAVPEVWQSKIARQLCVSRVLREQRVLAFDEPSSQRVGGFGLVAESRHSYVLEFALNREPPKLQQA